MCTTFIRKLSVGTKRGKSGWGSRGGRDLLWFKGSDVCIEFCRVYGRLWETAFQVERMASEKPEGSIEWETRLGVEAGQISKAMLESLKVLP